MDYVLSNVTPGGEQTIHLSLHLLPVENVLSCAQEEKIRNLCKTGCINFGKKWSCPPHSKKFSDIAASKKYDTVIVVVGYIFMEDMEYIKNPYQRVKAANIVLKSKCERVARNIEKEFNGYSLLSGSCNLCKPCRKKQGLPCEKPTGMRYSLESTGVDVGTLLEEYCGHKLLWYKKGEKLLYTSAVTAVLVGGNILPGGNLNDLMKSCIASA